ncbi:hypothetical protein [Vibrio hepatarius]|uniref:hypothetical protein n=1 Tax=Vibrio hepatarius TaxID=171383 RepID=UPI001C09B8C5|nr:hypothetical protein [Vibrio hepatarius]MBU2897952.1 hypothetical protein [Vibrio hepatarius]
MAKYVQPHGWRGALGHVSLTSISLVSRYKADDTQHESFMSRATSLTNFQNVLRRMLHFTKLAATQYIAQRWLGFSKIWPNHPLQE